MGVFKGGPRISRAPFKHAPMQRSAPPVPSVSTVRYHRSELRRRPSCNRTGGVQLVNAGSAALDQNAQHNDKENAGNNTNNCYAFHFKILLLSRSDRARSMRCLLPPTCAAFEPFSP